MAPARKGLVASIGKYFGQVPRVFSATDNVAWLAADERGHVMGRQASGCT